jgi:hypothetical protein
LECSALKYILDTGVALVFLSPLCADLLRPYSLQLILYIIEANAMPLIQKSFNK